MIPPRPPLDAAVLGDMVLAPAGWWRALEVVAETGSTNADVAAAARGGAAEGLIRVAEHQTAGRGRAGRQWRSPPRAGLAVSVLLRPESVPAHRWAWVSLLAGVAAAEAVRATAGLPARLKWPNDLLIGGAKCGGILAEVVDGALVVGVGLNVSTTAAELAPAAPGALPATSLALAGAVPAEAAGDPPGPARREAVLVALLEALAAWYGAWRAAEGDADRCGLRRSYLAVSATIGALVRAHLPGGGELTGMAEEVDSGGRLVIRDRTQARRRLAASDIVHVRVPDPTR